MRQEVEILPAEETTDSASRAKSYYVLVLVTFVWALSFTNRSIINVVIEPIKKEFALSDTVMGLMVGFGFVLIYSILAIPLARLADRRGRVSIIAAGVAFWSLMTSLGGVAQTVAQLLLTRIGLGVGESCATAPGNSLVSDCFPAEKRPMAMAIYSIAPTIGAYGAFLIGGFATTYWGWRSAFLFAGLPGFIIAALLWFTVKEPQRGFKDGKRADTKEYRLSETLRYFVKNRTYIYLVAGFCCTGYSDLTMHTWFAPFLMRVHNLSIMEVGTIGSTINSIGGILGVLLGGAVVTYVGKKGEKWKVLIPGMTSFLAGPALVVFLFAPLPLAWAGLVFSMFLMAFRMGPILSLVQNVVKVRMRAFAAAVMFMAGNLFGYGAGPFIIGVGNDCLDSVYGIFAIRFSLLTVPAMSVLGALFFFRAARYVAQDIAMSLAKE